MRSRENPALNGRGSCLIVSVLHYVLTCALFDTRMFACAMDAAKRPNKKINSCAVDTDVNGIKNVFQHRFLFK